jgi:hypothetical protein
MTNYEHWFTLTAKGKYQINSIEIYSDLAAQIRSKIAHNDTITDIIQWLATETTQQFTQITGAEPTDGALNNAIGRWNEFTAMTQLYEVASELSVRNQCCIAAFPLPNSTIQTQNATTINRPKFLELFHPGALDSIKEKASGIFFSSPDCIVSVIHNNDLIQTVRELMESQISQPGSTAMFKYLQNQLDFAEVRAAISFKTSNRPDRRYQPSFEAAMIKALGQHIGQPWKYYMVTNEFNQADALLFGHLITPTSVISSHNTKLVDDFLVYQRKEDLVPLLEAAIR